MCFMRTARKVVASALLLITAADRQAAAAPGGSAAPQQPGASAATDAERAQRVRVFVGAHQPELAELLDRL